MSDKKDKTYEPRYICWCEREFTSDVTVRRLTARQRSMLRSLLQGAFYCSTRPYLPKDDRDLADMADADNLKQWLKNKDAVMRKFTDEPEGWANKRLLRDWEGHLAAIERGKAGGDASAALRRGNTTIDGNSYGKSHQAQVVDYTHPVSTAPQRLSTAPGQTETETETETEIENSNSSVQFQFSQKNDDIISDDKNQNTVTFENKNTVDSTAQPSIVPVDSHLPVDYSEFEWRLLVVACLRQYHLDIPYSQISLSDLSPILNNTRTDPTRFFAELWWAFKTSNYWKHDKLRTLADVLRSYPRIAEQYEKYCAPIEDEGEPHNRGCGIPKQYETIRALKVEGCTNEEFITSPDDSLCLACNQNKKRHLPPSGVCPIQPNDWLHLFSLTIER